MTNPDFETDARGQTNPLDPDPAAPGSDADTADTVGVPAGSGPQIGESDSIDGAEVSTDSDDGDRETPIVSTAGLGDDSDLED